MSIRSYVLDHKLEILVKDIVYTLRDYFPYVDIDRVKVVICRNCKSKALARIYSLPTVWRYILKLEPMYIIEVIEKNFNSLTHEEKVKVIIHELLHIPKKFSGGLRPHGKYVNKHIVEKLFNEYIKRKSIEKLGR
ncbi:MAG: metallopeptidase [Desulfurococcaceae archaeon]|jgi:predicted metallopeptidase|nr:metallopeptidase [Desulfurococcaceae archaeon]MCC6058481.1 metallopeptidase [Desulfurococcaceae archaeon]